MTSNKSNSSIQNHYQTQVVDCKWKLDYNVKTNETHRVNKVGYTVQLQTDDGDSIDFTCNKEELQNMIAKLKEAAKVVERVSQ